MTRHPPPSSAGEPAAAPPRLSVDVAAEPARISGVRRAVCALAAHAGLGADRRAEVALAVGEACANVVVHAYPGPRPGRLLVTAWTTPEGLVVEVRDQGVGMAPRPDSPGLGLGLPLITSLATSVDLDVTPAGGTTMRMSFAPSTARVDELRRTA